MRDEAPYGAFPWWVSTGGLSLATSDAGVGDPAHNYYFGVQGADFGGWSNRVGVFTFGLAPGQ